MIDGLEPKEQYATNVQNFTNRLKILLNALTLLSL